VNENGRPSSVCIHTATEWGAPLGRTMATSAKPTPPEELADVVGKCLSRRVPHRARPRRRHARPARARRVETSPRIGSAETTPSEQPRQRFVRSPLSSGVARSAVAARPLARSAFPHSQTTAMSAGAPAAALPLSAWLRSLRPRRSARSQRTIGSVSARVAPNARDWIVNRRQGRRPPRGRAPRGPDQRGCVRPAHRVERAPGRPSGGREGRDQRARGAA
jgi:hypothetical protein